MAIMHRSDAKAGISETRVCAWKRAVVALAVAISLVFLPVVGTTAVAQDGASAVSQSDAAGDTASAYRTLTAGEIVSGKSTVTLRVDGQEVTQFNPPPMLPAHANLKFDLDITITDDAIHNGHPDDPSQYRLDWEYPLPVAYDSLKGVTDSSGNAKVYVIEDGGQTVGAMKVVKGSNSNAVLQVSYDRTYVKDNNKHTGFFFRYTADADWKADSLDDERKQSWEFPGVSTVITVQREPWGVTGQKSCTKPDVASLTSTCTVTLNAEGDIDNFEFSDTPQDALTITSDFSMTMNNVQESWTPSFIYGKDGSGRVANVSLDQSSLPQHGDPATPYLPKGTYTITYATQIDTERAETKPNDSHHYANAGNTATWRWKDHDEVSSTVETEVPSAHYNWVQKNGNWEYDQNGSKRIRWEVRINTASDKFDLSTYKFVDTLHEGHAYDKEAGVTVNYDWQEPQRVDNVEDSGFAYNADHTGFTFQFPDNAGKKTCSIVYYTTVSDLNILELKNTGVLQCKEGNCAPQPGGPVDAVVRDKFDDKLLTKTSTKPENGYEEVAGGVYKVPWQIDFDPKGRTDITDLFLYEDWVHGNSDGNTQHMWYSKDYLDLQLQEQGEDGKWIVIDPAGYTVVEANRNNPDGGCTQETRDDRADVCYAADARELPGGTDYPSGWYHDGGRNSVDTYGNHDGAPAFRVVFKNREQRFTKKLRITYNTLCDGAPDKYHNYAKFMYKINGTPHYEVPQTDVEFALGNTAGKMVRANNDGGLGWKDSAVAEQVPDPDPNHPGQTMDGWTAHWRVWSNGVKSWWFCDWLTDPNGQRIVGPNGKPYKVDIPGMNGIKDLSEVQQITVTDTLPSDKWHLNTNKPVFGWFVSMPDPVTLNIDDGRGGTKAVNAWPTEWNERTKSDEAAEQWHVFNITQNGTCEDKEGVSGTCATYSKSDGQIIFTIPNDGMLSNWDFRGDPKNEDVELTGIKGKNPTTGADESQIPVQGHSIIVLEFDTFITQEDAKLADNSTQQVTNRINFNLGDPQSYAASGTTTIAKGDNVRLNKWGQSLSDNKILYTVDVDTKKIRDNRGYDFKAGEWLTLDDQLGSPNAEYVRSSFELKIDDHKLGAEYLNLQFGTHNGTETVTARIRGDAQLNADRNLNTANVWLRYEVRVKGVIGQQLQIGNTAKMKGSSNSAANTTQYITIAKSSADMGAKGATVLTKVDGSGDGTARLPGAQFEVCEVNTGQPASMAYGIGGDGARRKPWTCSGASSTATTNQNGRIEFMSTNPDSASSAASNQVTGLKVHTLYVAWETKAPNGYLLDDAPHYFYIADDSNAVTDGQTSNLDRLRQYVVDNALVVTSSSFTVGDLPDPTVTLPSAGGRGMHLMALGLAVVAAGMCLAVVASGRGAKGRHAA